MGKFAVKQTKSGIKFNLKANNGETIDNAMIAIERENKALKGVLPKFYGSTDINKRMLGDVIDLFTNELPLGDIGGIPRVLDAGQCNDSYSLVLIALALRDAFGLDDVNQLPVAYNIAWYEQKAVIVLLALLYLGVKNIHLGPTLPAFLSPNVASVLVKNFGIGTISTVEDDIKSMI